MLKIIKVTDNSLMGYTDNPVYIQKADNGSYILCSEEEANGFVFQGTPYHLVGAPDLDGLETIAAYTVDAGEIMYNGSKSISDMENVICENDAIYSAEMANLENAMCEADAGKENV